MWRGLTESVNGMADNLTSQVRNIAEVTTAVANGDLSRKITVQAKGEVAELADTINTMVVQLNAFAAEVTRVAREVGTEGKPRRPGEGRGRQRRLARPDREREHARRQPVEPGAQHRRRDDRRRERRPDAQDHRRRTRRDPRAEEHDQHDGRPALVVRRRGDARRPRGRHRGRSSAARPTSRTCRARGRTSPTR